MTPERAAYEKEWRRKNRERIAEYQRDWTNRNRVTWRANLFFEFGPCQHCGFNDPRALQIDHVEGGGNKERRNLWSRLNTHQQYLAVRERFIRGELQILCANCNWIKRNERGECTQKRAA